VLPLNQAIFSLVQDVAAPSVQLPAPPPLQFNKLEIDGGASDRRKQKGKSKKEQKKVLLKKVSFWEECELLWNALWKRSSTFIQKCSSTFI
jgi:hypothetical protein